MSAPILQALVRDAVYQVLDSVVFRILVVLALVPVLLTFVVGFGEHEIRFLFGLYTLSYQDLLSAFGVRGTPPDMRGLVIEILLDSVFSYLAGGVGVVLCILATAFFVPNMLEKGAADVLFHKPVSRLGLYLSRYLAGLVFVGLLATLMVTGMYLGLLLVSGHEDLGVLLAAPTLVYLFGLVHTVSMLIGVLTRSTVAAILLSLLFFFGNGCLHFAWRQKELGQERRLEAPETSEAPEAEDLRVAEPPRPRQPGPWGRALRLGLDAAHWILPKTKDADVIARKLRQELVREAFRDGETRLVVRALPPGWHALEPEAAAGPSAAQLEALGERLFAAEGPTGERVELWRRAKRTLASTRPDGSTRERPERLSEATELLAAALREEEGVGDLEDGSLPRREDLTAEEREEGRPAAAFANQTLAGTRGQGGEARRLLLVTFSSADRAFTLLDEAPAGAVADGPSPDLASLLRETEFDRDPVDWYVERMDWSAEPKYNLWVSVATSLAFAAAMLLLGWLRLSRLDF